MMLPGFDAFSGATFSPCRRYRFTLWRTWEPKFEPVAFIGLNPSTADEDVDDPTIRRCVDFAKRWGGGGLVMLNLFGWRSTDPKGLHTAVDPIGDGNDDAIRRTVRSARLVVAAWGFHGSLDARDVAVRELVKGEGVRLWRLGTTKDGHPRHPLYMPAETLPEEWL